MKNAQPNKQAQNRGNEQSKCQKRPAENELESEPDENGVLSTDLEQMQETDSDDNDPIFETVEKRQSRIRKYDSRATESNKTGNCKTKKG